MITPSELISFPGGRLEIGNSVYINRGTTISAFKSVTIGNNCQIGTHCIITDNDLHSAEDHLARPESRPVVIEDDTWLGTRVIVLKGVTIGRGSSIGAGSVVTRSIPRHSIAAGVPARVIRRLETR
ncbi:MAG: acyltransferase [Chloroflexi bacterium]|nr:acyltransferase [Chloroflexota bacterium]